MKPTTPKPSPTRAAVSNLRRLREGAAEDGAAWARDRGAYQGRRTSDLAGMATDRDLTEMELLKARRSSRRNYKRSGIFGAMVDQAVCHVLGDGVSIQFEDDDVGEYVLGQLDAPRNAFLENLDETFRRWIVDGEQLVTLRAIARSETGVPTGDVWIGLKDPNEIRGFESDAWNDQRVTAVKLPAPAPKVEGGKVPEGVASDVWVPVGEPNADFALPPPLRVPSYDPEGKPRAFGVGSSMLWIEYLRLNALGARGVPLFSRSVDKVTLLDLLVDHLMAKAEYTNRHWLHIKYKPKDDGGKRDRAFEKKMLKWGTEAQPGEAAVTSDDVSVEVLAPDLKLPDQKALYEIGVGYILGSHSMPRVWFGESAGEKAGAAEAGSPIYRLLKWLQGRMRQGVCSVVRFLIGIGKASGKITPDQDTGHSVTMAEFATRDSVRDMQELTWGIQALDAALEKGSISREEHQRMVRKLIAGKPIGAELEDEAPPLLPLPGAGVSTNGLPLHQDGTGSSEPDPDAKAPVLGEKPGASASPPGVTAPGAQAPVAGAPTVEIQKTALNGAQIAAVVDVCTQVAEGVLSADTAKAVLALGFPGYDLEQIGTAVDAAEAEGVKRRKANEAAAARQLAAAEAAAKGGTGAPPEGPPKPPKPGE